MFPAIKQNITKLYHNWNL